MKNDLITVLETSDAMQAELLKSVIEAAGIYCLITSENDPLTPAFGTRLMVAPENEETARALIAENQAASE
jgi:hypothetical protein